MKGRLTWVCHAATASSRKAAFPLDEPLEDRAFDRAGGLSGQLARADRVWISPTVRARQTAALLGLAGNDESALRECDHGRWSGRTIVEIHAAEPAGIAAWMSDADAAPHGGEPHSALFRRVAGWLDQQLGEGGHTIAVTHASVIRAALLHVLGAPAQAFWAIDIEPLGVTEMSSDGRRWTLRLGRGLSGKADGPASGQ